jgi:peroxiredoxin
MVSVGSSTVARLRLRGLLTAKDTTSHDALVSQRCAPEVRGAFCEKSARQRFGVLPHRTGNFLRHFALPHSACRGAISHSRNPLLQFPRALTVCLFATLVTTLAYGGETELRSLGGAGKPPFVLSDLSGKLVDLTQQRGYVVFLHFFATWCEACREELPALRRLAERSAPDARVLAVSVGEPDLRVRRFAETITLNFPILLDRNSTVARSWQVESLPTTYVLDRNLRPSLIVESDFAWDALDLAELTERLAVRGVRPTGPTGEPRDPISIDREE